MKLLQKQFLSGDNDSIRLSSASFQGGRKYMEDEFSVVHYSPSQNEGKENIHPSVLKPFLFFGIFDGHGGDMASKYSRDNLCNNIIRQHGFWSENDRDVCQAIHHGFVATQKQMQDQVAYWPKTALGHMSTAGTTASVVFIMNGKYYTGHVGDSRIILARENKTTKTWESFPLTRDHKPNSTEERTRIEKSGGKVINKSGVSRVVWKRLKYSANPTPLSPPTSADFDVIPFLAVARALGDLWSYNKKRDLFVVSPEPDVNCVPITSSDQCLLLATDGLWNMVSNQTAVSHIKNFEKDTTDDITYASWDSSLGDISHSSYLVEHCMKKWCKTKYRADNITVLTVMLDIDRSKIKQTDSFSRPKVDEEGNLFCPNMIGKMINSMSSDESSNESDSDSEPYIPKNPNSRAYYTRNGKSTNPSKNFKIAETDIMSTIEELINNVCQQLGELNCELTTDNDKEPHGPDTSPTNEPCSEPNQSNGFDKNSLSFDTDEPSADSITEQQHQNNDKNNNNDNAHCDPKPTVDESGRHDTDDCVPDPETRHRLNVPVFTNSQMEEIQFTHVYSSEGFRNFQDSFCKTIHLDRKIFGSARIQDYPSQESGAFNGSTLMERSIAILNHNDLSYFHQEELDNDNASSATIIDSVIHSKASNGSTQNISFEMRTVSTEIISENSENACDFEMNLKRKIEETEIDITVENDCKASMAKRLCALNLTCEMVNDSN